MTTPPIPYLWDGDSFRPASNFAHTCGKHFVAGETYRLVEFEDRTAASHNHLFACISEVWHQLPDDTRATRFPSTEALRKFVQIKAGHCDVTQITANSKAEAERLATFARRLDSGYALVLVSGAVVTAFTAKSISKRDLNRPEFQAVKDKMLTALAEMIGTSPDTLSANAGQSA